MQSAQRVLVGLVALLFLGLIGYQLYQLNKQRVSLATDLHEAQARVDILQGERDSITNELEYLDTPRNFTKEIKEFFNYVEPGEELIIVISKGSDKQGVAE